MRLGQFHRRSLLMHTDASLDREPRGIYNSPSGRLSRTWGSHETTSRLPFSAKLLYAGGSLIIILHLCR